ncbi:hypothetical protein Y1Q_0015711 [Alligator mississippiensis]|uniref:Uncharacterized protein n=1 Tax=Alligator mississippiensis TaxID=8496 RepID=A0A151NNQ9_ALLMI|nr:hypothetical protein Y1Q_0015711 [Alligator mississippiensis]
MPLGWVDSMPPHAGKEPVDLLLYTTRPTDVGTVSMVCTHLENTASFSSRRRDLKDGVSMPVMTKALPWKAQSFYLGVARIMGYQQGPPESPCLFFRSSSLSPHCSCHSSSSFHSRRASQEFPSHSRTEICLHERIIGTENKHSAYQSHGYCRNFQKETCFENMTA